jgi:16S rRNA U516 pseudouridylate synthase RsuA-like enzyme
VELRRPPREPSWTLRCRGRRAGRWPTAPAEVGGSAEREIEIVLREGRNRQVRRMAEAVDNEVVALRRVRFGRSTSATSAEERGPPPRPTAMLHAR